ncbi:cilia- and flagella-associated protein 54 [Brachyistius frenatus]|uniref:cilia- and flagella-associated protein 54 n=1 Tax=Brachyistius frenatus TaxID=100188 RepID=UPI0037E88538
MDLPATFYGELDKRNPVLVSFKRDINSFMTQIKQFASVTDQDNRSYARGIKTLVEIWKKYNQRLPSNLYQEHMLQIADFLFGLKMFHLALWKGFGLHLQLFSSVNITDITGVDHFMSCFFPEGFDTDQEVFVMKMRAMKGCASCIFEEQKNHSVLSQTGLGILLRVLNFMRIMMQAFQQHEHLHVQLYDGASHIYNISCYLMTMNHSAQVLEYLLWASISLELSIPLMTVKYLPLIVTLYCAVCQCYYDNQAEEQAEKFGRRALGKIVTLAELEEPSEGDAETQRAFREASIKLGAMIFKQAAFVARRPQRDRRLEDIVGVPWPQTATGRVLSDLFDCSAAHFLVVLEALGDDATRLLQGKMPDDLKHQKVVMELLSAGLGILSGVTSSVDQRCGDHSCLSPAVLTTTSSLLDLATTGENKVPVMSAVKFIKLLFQYRQLDSFSELSREMLQVLSGLEDQSFRKAECDLTLLSSFNSLQSSQQIHPRRGNTDDVRQKPSFSISDEIPRLLDALHTSVCGSAPEEQPDRDLVLEIVFSLWSQMKVEPQRDQLTFTHSLQKVDDYHKCLCCLSALCDVASSGDLASVDCLMMADMMYTLGTRLERAAQCWDQTQWSGGRDDDDDVKPSCFSLLQSTDTQLLLKVCEVVQRGLGVLTSGVAALMPRDSSAVAESAFMQKFSPSVCSPTSEEGAEEDCQHTLSTNTFLLARDLHLKLNILHHRTSLQLLQRHAVTESEVLERIKRNKVSRAHLLLQKVLLLHNREELGDGSETRRLLKEASALTEKAAMEERRVHMSYAPKPPDEKKSTGRKREERNPAPPPILLSRTDHSFTFSPAPYNLEREVFWYQLCGRVTDSFNQKVRLRDCSLTGTGDMVPAVSGECVLTVDRLQPNQTYVFAVAAYNRHGMLLGNTIGETTFPLLASMPLPLLSTWAHLAQVAFQTQQYDVAQRACRVLWSHFTLPDRKSNSSQGRLANTRLNTRTLQSSSPHLVQLFLTSIFTETEINIQQGALFCDSFSDLGPFTWEQEARLSECERMLVAMDTAMCLKNGTAAVQAAVTCYGLLAPLIFHQISAEGVVYVLKKCLMVLFENSGVLKQKWTEATNESLMHMVTCITYYLSKMSQVLQKHRVGNELMDCGRRLLQDICGSKQTEANKTVVHGAVKGHMKIILQLKALQGKHKKNITSHIAAHSIVDEVFRPLTDCEDPAVLFELISCGRLEDAYVTVMKLRGKACFIEFASQLLQRSLEEGQSELVLTWGYNIFQFLSWRDETTRRPTRQMQKKRTCDNTGRKRKQKTSLVLAKRRKQTVKKLLTMMSQCYKQQLRRFCREERVWRSYLHHSTAQAHLTLLHQEHGGGGGGGLHLRYSQFTSQCFPLASHDVLQWTAWKQQPSSGHKDISEGHSSHSGLREDKRTPRRDRDKDEAEDHVTESCKEEDFSQSLHRSAETQRPSAAALLGSLHKAASHLRRAMVLAHRGGHWTALQSVCQTVWNQNRRFIVLLQAETPSTITSEQHQSIFTPLLVLATDFIMDMVNTLGLWRLYDQDSTEDELESGLHFSAPLDDSTQVDLRWTRTLVLHTLERLHDSSKWESLAHFALLFNSYTRERYACSVTPLLLHAQRRLLERITSFGGPAVPQPHHVRTLKDTGTEVTSRSYATCQLLSGWTPQSCTATKHKPALRRAAELKGAEQQLSMSLVCVPLDVEDTLHCYHQALENKPAHLQQLEDSRSMLLQLLVDTWTCSAPSSNSCHPETVFSLHVPPDRMSTVLTAYSTSFKHLHVGCHNSLRVQVLHETGDLQLFNGRPQAALSCWSQAVDIALQSSDTVKRWDGVSCGGGSLQQTLRRAGLWGCLQAAVLTAKIAQFIFTSPDMSQRTDCCLLSAHLFKCVLCCSMARPQDDLQYASYRLTGELFPGVDLFSEPRRLNAATTVTSLGFVCHWLYGAGYHLTLLPVLTLHLHFVGTVCRDVRRTVEGRTLKIRALTELSLFSEAVKEALFLSQGGAVMLPHGRHIITPDTQPKKNFCNNKTLVDNMEGLEEFVKCDFPPEVCSQFGLTLCIRINLARVQLVLAIANTVRGRPAADCVEGEDGVDTEDSCRETEQPNILDPERIKLLLLEAASSWLLCVSQQLPSHQCSDAEKLELTIESSLLKAKLYLQQGRAAVSSKVADSCLLLLRTSPVIVRRSRTAARRREATECNVSYSLEEDCPAAVEASERVGLSLWLRCRLVLVHSLVALIPDLAAPYKDKNIVEAAARVIQKSLDESSRWGDRDVQTLLMVERAELEARRGRTKDSMATLQEAVSLLSDWTSMSPGCSVTLARAALLLSDLRGEPGRRLLDLTRKLLEKQLRVFGQTVMLADGKLGFPPGITNMYLPHLHLLQQTTERLGN